jgi:5-formyltetrahydrofolate cyclo-ligase
MQQKAELRKTLKAKRLELKPEAVNAMSHAIVGQLIQQINWSETRTIHLFESIAALNEVKLDAFVQWLRAQHPEVLMLTSRQIDGEWQVVSLKTGQAISKPTVDVVIVPMLGFDKNLHRIGYGGGYYDRFLATQPDAKKIGVCFEQGRIEKIETEAHDIPLNKIVTESFLY